MLLLDCYRLLETIIQLMTGHMPPWCHFMIS